MADGAEQQELKRSSAFSYDCGACSRCCHNKGILLNPYAIARLADHLGLTTTEVISNYTEHGVVLRVRENGACVFLGPEGCSVHSDRPLACRLYPLGQVLHSVAIATASHNESFVEVERHPGCVGVRGIDGTVADYLAAQQVEPYLEAADQYYRLYQRMVALLDEQPQSSALLEGASEQAGAGLAAAFIDMDLALRERCAQLEQPRPTSPVEKMHLHIKELYARFGLGA